MPAGKLILETRDLWKSYSHGDTVTHALRGIDLKIFEGDYIALFGPSGSGKSTLMHILGCLDTPTKGRVFFEGHDISHLSEDELALIRRNKIGFIFQAYNLIPGLSAVENVAIPMRFAGVSKTEAENRAKNLLKTVGLGDRMEYKPNQLSGGQQQRVAIARALINNPDIILADEPTGNLDTKTGSEIIEVLHELQKNHKKTIIVVTHDSNLAKKARKQFLIKDGQVADIITK